MVEGFVVVDPDAPLPGFVVLVDVDLGEEGLVEKAPHIVDLYGWNRWYQLFHDFFEDPQTLDRLMALDSQVQKLPGMEGIQAMGPTLERRVFPRLHAA